MGWKLGVVLATAAAGLLATEMASAGEFLGIDPYGRAVFAPSGPFPIVPSRVRGPVFKRNPGPFAGPDVGGPLYYAEPAPPVPGFYRPDPAVSAGAILAFDTDAALGAAEGWDARDARCAARYRSFDPATGTYVSARGVRRICR
ncbi:BA14K family protein [Aureimonas sp. AU4]|uniref:BA14K family protein n=1 Tax=Aureimonas sp. AU4 TaxID=1638163 RepID=UPI001FCD43A2|nr:BA14K family protein [Aureimonas sp. AU4]